MADILALLAGVFGVATAIAATNDVKMAETWRVVGFFTFALLFLLLGLQSNLNLRLWEIVTANKIILAGIGLLCGADISAAMDAAMWDGALAVLLGAGYILVRCGMPRSHKAS